MAQTKISQYKNHPEIKRVYMSTTEFQLLEMIKDYGAIHEKELAQQAVKDGYCCETYAYRIVELLIKKGLVTRNSQGYITLKNDSRTVE